MKRTISTALFLSLGLLAGTVQAKTPDYVTASLVAADASIKAGSPFTVALRFVHQPHWHTYWVNPGTGLPTTLKWTLPPGWSAGDIQWPAPMLLSDTRGNVIGNGYDGDLLLPVTITPSADLKAGTSADIKVTADWLMCQEECVPGNATLTLSLPVSAGDPQPDPVWGARIRSVVDPLP